MNAAAHKVTEHSLQQLPRKFQGPLNNPAKTTNLTEFTEYQDASRSVKKFLNLLNQYDVWNGTDTYPRVNKWEYAKLQHAILTVSTESGGTLRDLLCRHILSSGQHMSDKLKDMEIRNLHSNFLSILPSESHLLKTLIYERRLPFTAERVISGTESINQMEDHHLDLDTYLETIVQIIFQQCEENAGSQWHLRVQDYCTARDAAGALLPDNALMRILQPQDIFMYLAKYCCGKFHNIVLKTEDLKSFVVNMKYQSIKAPQARALAATNAGMILHMFTARYIASSNQRGDTPEELVAIKDMKNQMEILAALVLSIGDNHAYSPAEILLIDTILKYADI